MQWLDVLIVVFIVTVIVGIVLYFVNRWASKKMAEQQDMVQRTKTTVSIYVIDKKKDKPANANFPKAIIEQMPKVTRMMKMPLVKAKVGPQIVTLMCDKAVFDVLPLKKTVKIDLAGMYIVGMKGMKTKQEMAALKKAKHADASASASLPQPWYKKITARLGRS